MESRLAIVTYNNSDAVSLPCIKSAVSLALVPVYVYDNSDNVHDQASIRNYCVTHGIPYEFLENKGGLTGAWNKAAKHAIRDGVDCLILSNNDVIFNESLFELVAAVEQATEPSAFGPLSNSPGTGAKWGQQGTGPQNRPPVPVKEINGFCMAITKSALLATKRDDGNYFDPALPFGGNESEWCARLASKGGKFFVVPKAFVSHLKLNLWNKPKSAARAASHSLNTSWRVR